MKKEIGKSRSFVNHPDFEQDENIGDLFKTTGKSGPIPKPTEANPGKSLLDAIEGSKGSLDREIRDVLMSFLQSEDVKARMVQAATASVRQAIGGRLSRDISALYLPVLRHSHRRLLRHLTATVEDAYMELGEYTGCLSSLVSKLSQSLTQAIELHKALLDAADPRKKPVDSLNYTVEELLSKELKQWRQKVLDIFKLPSAEGPESPNPGFTPSTPQPNPITVEISKQIKRGEINAAFERALSASDLSLVVWACRSAGGSAFSPRCLLRQDVLLALMQQLSTDMLHDTHLKCRYIEDIIVHLDRRNPVTSRYLPLVVAEVRKHLTEFITAWPAHVAGRRMKLIMVAAENLLK